MEEIKLNIYQKLLSVKKQVPYLQKDGSGHQYRYATPSQVLGVFNPLLNEVGIILKTEVLNATYERVFVKNKKDKEKTTQGKPQKKDLDGDIIDSGEKAKDAYIEVYESLYTLEMRFTWVDVETGDKDENLFFASGLNGDEKGVGSALTYAERYFFLKYFNVPTDNDDPDYFQEKFLSDDQKKEIENSKIESLLKECKSVESLGDTFKMLSKDKKEAFKELVTKLKLDLETNTNE